MSIATEIQRLQTAKADIKTAIEAKGVSVPSDAKLDVYDDYVAQISRGNIGDTGITTTPIEGLSLLCSIGNTTITEINDNLITTINRGSAFNACTALTSVTMNALTTISGSYSFNGCTVLTSVTMNALTTISGRNTFNGCTALTSVTMNALTTINAQFTFNGCTVLTSVTMNNLRVLSGGSTFASTAIINAYFPMLEQITDLSAFYRISVLKTLTVGKLTNLTRLDLRFCSKLESIIIGNGTDINLDISYWYASSVTDDALLNANFKTGILDNLYDYSGGTAHTIRIGWLSRLSQDNIDYANSKGWNITA